MWAFTRNWTIKHKVFYDQKVSILVNYMDVNHDLIDAADTYTDPAVHVVSVVERVSIAMLPIHNLTKACFISFKRL